MSRIRTIYFAAITFFLLGFSACAPTMHCQVVKEHVSNSDLQFLFKNYDNIPIILLADTAYYCPCSNRRSGGGIESRRLGGDTEARKVGGDTEARKLGGETEARKLGGDTEARKLGGETEARKLGGDTEARKLGGETEARKLGGNTEARRLGGDMTTLVCTNTPKCSYFVVSGINNPVQFYDGKEIRSVMPGNCIE